MAFHLVLSRPLDDNVCLDSSLCFVSGVPLKCRVVLAASAFVSVYCGRFHGDLVRRFGVQP